MHHRLLTAFAIVALCALGGCGDKDEGPATQPEGMPPGFGGTTPDTPSTPPKPGDWTSGQGLPEGMPDMSDPEAMKKALEGMGLGNIPDPNDPEAMREWTKDMQERGAQMFDRLAGEVSEDDLKQWSELKGEIEAAHGDTAKLMALYKQHGGMMKVMKLMKVPAALKAYELRRDSGRLTDKDKANATMYETYLKMLDK